VQEGWPLPSPVFSSPSFPACKLSTETAKAAGKHHAWLPAPRAAVPSCGGSFASSRAVPALARPPATSAFPPGLFGVLAHAGVKLNSSPSAESPAVTPILSKTPLQSVLQGCRSRRNTKQVKKTSTGYPKLISFSLSWYQAFSAAVPRVSPARAQGQPLTSPGPRWAPHGAELRVQF